LKTRKRRLRKHFRRNAGSAHGLILRLAMNYEFIRDDGKNQPRHATVGRTGWESVIFELMEEEATRRYEAEPEPEPSAFCTAAVAP
jgi:hypothetical protein